MVPAPSEKNDSARNFAGEESRRPRKRGAPCSAAHNPAIWKAVGGLGLSRFSDRRRGDYFHLVGEYECGRPVFEPNQVHVAIEIVNLLDYLNRFGEADSTLMISDRFEQPAIFPISVICGGTGGRGIHRFSALFLGVFGLPKAPWRPTGGESFMIRAYTLEEVSSPSVWRRRRKGAG